MNLIASIALGYLLAVLEHRPDLRALLVPGVVGGFGTLSLVAVEVVQLWDDGHALTAVAYLLATVVGGIVCVIAGLALGRHPVLRPPHARGRHVVIFVGVAIAGAVGAMSRAAIERWFEHHHVGPSDLPVAFYVINPLGAFLLGLTTVYAEHATISGDTRVVAGIGFCGAFTVVGPLTFDSVRLFVEGHAGRAGTNLALGTLIPLAAAAAGLALG